jgi:zinc protease
MTDRLARLRTRARGASAVQASRRSARIPAFALCLLVLALAAPCALAADRAQLTVLPNGLRVLTQEVHAAPVVSVYTWYHAGSRNEYTGITGISHFVEHMVFKGTTHYQPGEVTRLITRTGGWDNGMTWLDFTAYVETLPAEHLGLALRIEADRMVNATFAREAVDAERTVVLSELEGDENDPGFYLNNAVWATAFVAHPYQWPTIGWKSDVQAYGRAAAVDYYRGHYAPNDATLVIVGDFDTGSALKRVRELFGGIRRAPAPPKVVTVEPTQRGERRVIVRRPGAAGMIQMAFHVPPASHPDHFALDVVESVLGSGRTSRLYRELVDRSIAVSADAYNFTNRDPTLFTIYITLAQGVQHDQAEQAALGVIDRLASELISERELQRAKNQVKASLVYGADSVSSLGDQLGFFDVVANFRLLYEYVDRINGVTPERVREVVQRYLTADNRTVGWFVPTGEAPSGPSMPAGPISRSAERPPSPPVRLADASAPVASEQGSGSRPGPSREAVRIVLDNGAVFIVYENPVVPAVSIRGMVGAGSVFDPPDKPGLASFTAAMLSRGAGARSEAEIADALEFVAADASVDLGIQVANISGRCLKADLPLVMEILADEVQRPRFAPDQVALQRSQLEVAIREALQDTGEVAERAFYAALYPEGHPLHNRPLGTLQSIAAITREHLVGFHRRYYRPDTLVLAVVGDVTADQVRELATKYFGDWRTEGERPEAVIPPVAAPADTAREAIAVPGKAQSDIIIGFPGSSRLAPDYYAAELLNYVLGGGGLSSRLAERIRDEEGLAYYVYSYFAAYRGPGPWSMNMGVNPARVNQAIDSALAVLRRVREQPPGEAELRLWKDYVTGTLSLRLETNSGIAASLADAEFYGLGLDYPWRYPQVIARVTPAEVAAAAEKYIQPDHAVIVIAGPELPPTSR